MTIVRTFDTCGGQPRIEDHRVTVVNILGFLAGGMSIKDICDDFSLTEKQVVEAIEWCKDYIDEQF